MMRNPARVSGANTPNRLIRAPKSICLSCWRLLQYQPFFVSALDCIAVAPKNAADQQAEDNQHNSISFGALYSSTLPGTKDFRALLRAGYRSDPNEDDMDSERVTAWGVSGGVGHSSGFTVSGSYGTSSEKGKDVRPYKWNAEVGWAGKVNDMGKTNVTVGYGHYNDGMYGEAKYYYFAINQAIDSAAADVYFGVSNDTGTMTHTVKYTNNQVYALNTANGKNEQPALDETALGTADNFTADDACGAVPAADPAAITGAEHLAHNGSKCSVKRDGVLVILAGVRIKF